MKTTANKIIGAFKQHSLTAMLIAAMVMTGCDKDKDEEEPPVENEEEIITDVTLVFTNASNPDEVVKAKAEDPDGDGVAELEVLGPINLDTSKTYNLTMEIFNSLESPAENIGTEISEEDDEHQIFFSFTPDAFATPVGNGNIDKASDAITYNDKDGNGNSLGLKTSWTTSSKVVSGGTFTVRLQHQPDVKTATSGASDGDTDFELEFVLNIK